MSTGLRGIFAIAQMPCNERGDFMWEDFERECDWTVRAGAHGLVWPVMASEYTVISFPERVQGMRLAVSTVGKRIPVVIGVADTSKAGAVALAEEAGKAGADAIIAMPPWATKLASHGLVEDFYRSLASAAGIPVIIQNCDPPLGSSLAGSYVVELCKKITLVQYLKEEKSPQAHSVSEVIDLAGPEVRGVFSGSGGLWLIPEHKRGVCGNMPANTLTDVDAQIWDLLEAGEEEEARRLHNIKLVLENVLRGIPGRRGRKEVMVRRGIFSYAASRNQGIQDMDEVDRAEFDYGYALLEPYFRA
jgi:4-hydroxy-tetrahydrodipicolinate synthase